MTTEQILQDLLEHGRALQRRHQKESCPSDCHRPCTTCDVLGAFADAERAFERTRLGIAV